MANLIEYIQGQIYENSTEDITGSIMQQVLTRMVSDEGVINVHTVSGQSPFAVYSNAQAARDAVPAGFKKLGLVITYKLAGGWFVDEYIGTATSGWSTASNWKCLGPISVSQNAQTGKTTITIGSESFDVATQPVSVSQNTETGKQELSIGGETLMRTDNEQLQMENHLSSTAVSGVVLSPFFAQDGKYIKSDGADTSSGSYHRTDFIKVFKGQRFNIRGYGSSNVRLIACFTSNDLSTYVGSYGIAGQGADAEVDADFTVPDGINYIILSNNKSHDCKFKCLNFILDDYLHNMELYDRMVNGGTFVITTPLIGYVKSDGTINTTSTGNRRSELIPVYEGQKISITCDSSTSVFAISAFSSYDWDSFISGSPLNLLGTGSQKTYNFIVPEGVKAICVSRKSSSVESNSITYENIHKEILILDRKIEGGDELVSFPNSGYINTSGEVVSSSSYSISDFIKVKKGKRLTLTSKGSANVLVLSAYSDASQQDFISASPLDIAGNGDVMTVDVVVPEGVNYIRVCKNNNYTENINIHHYGLTDDVAKVASQAQSLFHQPPFYAFKSTSPRKPCIVFQMDWGYRTGATYKAYHDLLKTHGVDLSTYAVEPKFFEQDLNAMRSLYNEGNEIALHTDSEHSDISSSSELTVEQFKELMGTYHQEMIAAGLDYTGCVVLSVNLKSTFFEPIKAFHNWTEAGPVDINAKAENYLNQIMNLSSDYKFPLRLGMELDVEEYEVPGAEETQANRIINAIDTCVANGGMLILYSHSYMSNAPYTLRENVLVPVLQHLQPLLQKGVCLTGRTSELLEYYFTKRFDE